MSSVVSLLLLHLADAAVNDFRIGIQLNGDPVGPFLDNTIQFTPYFLDIDDAWSPWAGDPKSAPTGDAAFRIGLFGRDNLQLPATFVVASIDFRFAIQVA